jgi:hypothetical protein
MAALVMVLCPADLPVSAAPSTRATLSPLVESGDNYRLRTRSARENVLADDPNPAQAILQTRLRTAKIITPAGPQGIAGDPADAKRLQETDLADALGEPLLGLPVELLPNLPVRDVASTAS